VRSHVKRKSARYQLGSAFERAEAFGLTTTDVIPIQLRRAGISEFNPAYIAAIFCVAVEQITLA
jgi:hypothetical protein